MFDSKELRERTYYWKTAYENRFRVIQPSFYLLGNLPHYDYLCRHYKVSNEWLDYVMESLVDNFGFHPQRLKEWGKEGQVKFLSPKGKEIVAEVPSMSDPQKKYTVRILNTPLQGDEETILKSLRNIDATCTCDFGKYKMNICSVPVDVANIWGISKKEYDEMMKYSKPYAQTLDKHVFRVMKEISLRMNRDLQKLRCFNNDIFALFFVKHAGEEISQLYESNRKFTLEQLDARLRKIMDYREIAGKKIGLREIVRYYRKDYSSLENILFSIFV